VAEAAFATIYKERILCENKGKECGFFGNKMVNNTNKNALQSMEN
jgi:hypothetical protein